MNYAYIAKVETVSNGVDENGFTVADVTKALVYFADGTSKVVVVNTTADGAATLAEESTGIYNVVMGKDGKAVVTAIENECHEDVTITKGVSKVGDSLYANNNTIVFFVSGEYGVASNPLTVKIVKGIANIPTGTALSKAYKTTGTPDVVTVGLSAVYDEGQTPDLVYYAGEYTTETGEKTTVTYTVYKNGEKTTVSYTGEDLVAEDEAGFYTLGKLNLEDISESAKVAEDVETSALYAGTLTADDEDYQVTSDTKIVDLTPADQTYTALVVDGKTVTVSIAYTQTAGSDIKTATVIYVTSVA